MEKQRKRRRYGLLFLLSLGLLCLVAGGFWVFAPKEMTKPVTEQTGISSSESQSSSVFEVEPKTDLNENVIKNEKAESAGSATIDKEPQPKQAEARNLAAGMTMSIDQKIEARPTAISAREEVIKDKPTAISAKDEANEILTRFEKKQFGLDGLNYLDGDVLKGNCEVETSALNIDQFFKSTYHFYSEVGVGANPSFATPGEQRWHYAPYYEFGINRLLSRKLGIETGLGYAAISGINRSLEREDLSYSFIGSRRSQTLIHQQSQWLSVPLRLEYRLAPSLKARLGLRLSYLVQTQSMLETVNENDLGAKTTNAETVRQYMDGLRRMNYQIEAGMSFSPATRWEIQARAVRGLNSITHSDILSGGGQDRSLQLQLGIRWYLK